MSPTDEEIARRELALNCAINTQSNRADRAESDLSAAREEIDRVGKYLFRAQVALHMCNSVFVPGNDDANARIADFLAELDENFSSDKAEEWASEALGASRTNGVSP